MPASNPISNPPTATSAAPLPDALPECAVEARGLVKTYRAQGNAPANTALRGIDLAIPRGSLFGLLGPNGAGKSTFINILAGLVMKTAGTVKVWDADIDTDTRRARAAIGVVPQELNLDAFFTPRELLDVQAGLYGVPPEQRRTMELLELLGLDDKADSYARNLSGGMRRRLMVAKAMVHDPPVLVLDEPTAGVDVELRRSLWAMIRELSGRGTTVVLTTHYLEEAEMLCDRIAIINHGDVIAVDRTEALVRQLDRKDLRLTLGEKIEAIPPALTGFDARLEGQRQLCITYRPSQTRVRDILQAVRETGLSIIDLTTHEGDLEDIFLELTRAEPEAAQ